MTALRARSGRLRVATKNHEHTVAIFYRGAWKETRLKTGLDKACETARDVHRKSGLIVQVRDLNQTILAQFGYPIAESVYDDTSWVEED